MFGAHQLLEHRLRKSGRSALATVLSCEQKETVRENTQAGAWHSQDSLLPGAAGAAGG